MPSDSEKVEVTVIADFAGLATSVDALDTETGVATNQTNCVSIVPGELQVRGGIKVVSFEAF